jgi:biopolymer transport protein ExbD
MNVLKNMEAIFVVAAVLATATTFATASVPAAVTEKASVTAAADSKMQVITIKGKRLTAAEKAALI